MIFPARSRLFRTMPAEHGGAFSPATVARSAAGADGGNLRTSLGSEAARIGDEAAFSRLIRAMLDTGGAVRLTARPGRAVVAELRGTADVEATVQVLGGVTEAAGGTMRAILPLAESPHALGTDDPPRDTRLEGLRLLVADDSATNRLVLSEMLRGGGARVALAEDGPQAVEAALADRFDLLLLDIAMPGMDGTEALAAIRRGGITVPAIAVTANAMAHQVEEYLACGFASHLAKPLRREDLILKIAGLIA